MGLGIPSGTQAGINAANQFGNLLYPPQDNSLGSAGMASPGAGAIGSAAAGVGSALIPKLAKAAGGAASLTPWGAAASIVPSIFGAIEGIGQRRQAKRLRASAVDPGYQMNQGVLQNEQSLRESLGNYQIPGYTQALNNIGASSATAFNSGLQGASSSGDVLDLATRIAYGTGEQKRQLEVQNAQGKNELFDQYLNANVAAGQERQNSNAYQRQKYQQQLAEAAALYNAGSQNINSALGGVSSVGTSLLMNPRRTPPKSPFI